MNRDLLVIIVFFIAGIFCSCRKTTVVQGGTEPKWIKVIADSVVHFPGKIRADAHNNLYCSYNYKDGEISGTSAIVKLDSNGSVACRKIFTDIAIYDFVIAPSGNLVIASYSYGVITVTELSPDLTDLYSNSYTLPVDPAKIKNFFGMKIFLDSFSNVYDLCGSLQIKQSIGFMAQVTPEGILNWMQIYPFLPANVPATHITGCAQTADGFILFGNERYKSPDTSRFFIMHADIRGVLDTEATKFYTTSTYDAAADTYAGYYCGTSDIIPSNTGTFFGCAYNIEFNTFSQHSNPISTTDDNSARIFEFSPEGDTLRSTRVKFSEQNEVGDFALKKNGGLFIGLNPNELGDVAIVFERSSFISNLSPTMAVEGIASIQSEYSDYLGSVCAMPDGHYAIEIMIQSLGGEHYFLEVIKTDENGNF